MNIIKNPLTDHLPIGCKIIGTSSMAELKPMSDYVLQLSPMETISDVVPICYVIGAVSVGNPGMENELVQ